MSVHIEVILDQKNTTTKPNTVATVSFQIMKDCSERNPDYCSNTVDVSNYLDLTSKEDHDLFCLVFTFTYRDFSGGTLGLAWVATESSKSEDYDR